MPPPPAPGRHTWARDHGWVPSRVERYLSHLQQLCGVVEPRFVPIESTQPGLNDVTVIMYDDLPEPGMSLALTYGVSLAHHPAWTESKPELCISVNSTDERWGLVVGFLAEKLRGDCGFEYGDLIRFGDKVTEESDLTAFAIFAPAVMNQDDATVDVGEDLPIHIAGCYPIHESEYQFIGDEGLQAFFSRKFNPFDVKRPAVA